LLSLKSPPQQNWFWITFPQDT